MSNHSSGKGMPGPSSCLKLPLHGSIKLLSYVPVFLWLCLVACSVSAQQSAPAGAIPYARLVIDTLTSAALNGRGYVDSGDWKAARYLAKEFQAAGVQPFAGSFFQQYRINANVFPGAMKFEIGHESFKAGTDFLVDAGSASCKGQYQAQVIHKSLLDTGSAYLNKLIKDLSGQQNSGKVLFIARDSFTASQYQHWQQALSETDAFGAAAIVECSEKKLTWHASQIQYGWCQVQLKRALPRKISRKISIEVHSIFKQDYLTQNVIGYIKGKVVPDSFLVFTAHYDHLGQMGDGTRFPGANDNASGTSMVLNLAKYYALHPPDHSVAFMFFSGEELGLLGSRYYVNHPLFPLHHIRFLINLDIVGTGDEGIKVVNATEFKEPFEQMVSLNTQQQLLKVVSPRSKAANSDHHSFFEKGVPCFFIYTMGGIAAYHDVLDLPQTLPLTAYENLMKLLIDFAAMQ